MKDYRGIESTILSEQGGEGEVQAECSKNASNFALGHFSFDPTPGHMPAVFAPACFAIQMRVQLYVYLHSIVGSSTSRFNVPACLCSSNLPLDSHLTIFP
jgi:hypothetical protein